MVETYFDKWHGQGDSKTRLLLVLDDVGGVRGSWHIKLVHARHRRTASKYLFVGLLLSLLGSLELFRF